MNIDLHAVSNMCLNHPNLKFVMKGIPAPYVSDIFDPEGFLLWSFFGNNDKQSTLDNDKLVVLASMLGYKTNIEIIIMDSDPMKFMNEPDPKNTVVVSKNRICKLAFLEAFTNACKYGKTIYISNHSALPLITISNTISDKPVKFSSGFGTKAFAGLIYKVRTFNSEMYTVHIDNCL